jgi:hypothetical protein
MGDFSKKQFLVILALFCCFWTLCVGHFGNFLLYFPHIYNGEQGDAKINPVFLGDFRREHSEGLNSGISPYFKVLFRNQ